MLFGKRFIMTMEHHDRCEGCVEKKNPNKASVLLY